MTITYRVHVPSDKAAGIQGVDDTITIFIASGDPGGQKGEFIEHMCKALSEWYEGGVVSVTTRI